MLVDLETLVVTHQMDIDGVLHVGAHVGEEAAKYHSLGITNVWWVEANPDLIPQLEANVSRYGHHVINALITDRDGVETKFNVTNNMQSSSVLELGTHRQQHPDVHVTGHKLLLSTTLDTLMEQANIRNCNMWNFDLQGAELLALQGGAEHLWTVDYLYLEVNRAQVYQGNALIGGLDEFLSDFTRYETEWNGDWGDALWVRT